MLKNKKHYRASRKYSSRTTFIKSRKKKTKIIISIIFVIIFLIGLLYVLFFSSVFKIKNISVSFNNGPFLTNKQEIKSLLEQELKTQKFLGLKRDNIFLFNSQNAINKITNDSRIESGSAKKDIIPPCKFSLIISEAKPVANLSVLGGKNYFISSKGKIIKVSQPRLPPKNLDLPPKNHSDAPDKPQKIGIKSIDQTANIYDNKDKNHIETLPQIYDKTHLNLNTKKISELFKKIIDFINAGTFTKNRINIDKVNLKSKSGGVVNIDLVTKDGWIIQLTSEVNFKKQLQNLELTLNNKIDDLNNLKYIDLRFNDKIFYKYKE